MTATERATPPPHADAPVTAGSPAFLFDPNRCTGCAACVLACSTENGLAWGRSWRQIVPFNPERRPGVPSFHLSLACNHCDEAPCVAHCPTGAMTRDPRTGAVAVDEARCIGCRYCAWVCPYDAPRFGEERGVMTKCTLCNHRLLEGRAPACVEACPTDALGFGDPTAPRWMGEPPGFPSSDAAPRIAFAPLRRRGAAPAGTWALPEDVAAAFAPPEETAPATVEGANAGAGAGASSTTLDPHPEPWGPNRISFRGELPLLAFTSGAAALVGWVGAGVLGGRGVSPVALGAAAAGTILISTLHLARPGRAWRAAANLRTSHLSREIAGYGAFVASALAWSLAVRWGWAGALPLALAWVCVLLGVAALLFVDRVYDPVRPPSARPLHAGDAVLMGPLVGAAHLSAAGPYAALAAVKLVLYVVEARSGRRQGRARSRAGAWLAAVGVAGLVIPPVLWSTSPDEWVGWGAAAALLGAIADRARLYLALAIPTPRGAAIRDAAGLISQSHHHHRRHPTDAGTGC